MSKTLLVTGGAGFVAHHVIEYFLDNTDWKIISLDRLDFSGNLNRLHEITKDRKDKNRVSVVHHDLRAPISPQIIKTLGDVNIILHLAAASHVTRSIQFPLEFVESNINGTVNLLEYARTLNNLERFFYFSTDEVFGPAIPGKKFSEFDRFNATNPYSASKAAGESMCVAYHNTYKLPIYISHCHDEETKAWTEDGIKNVADVKIGDKVWVLKNNKELALEPILEIVHNPYEGKMIHFKSQKYDLCVTPNHRMLTRHRNEKDYRISTAQEIFEDSSRNHIPTSGEWNGNEIEEIDITNFVRKSFCKNTKTIPLKWKVEEFLDLIGWYVSEGFCRTSGKGEVSISQKNHSLDHLVNGELGFQSYSNDNGVKIYTKHSVLLSDFLTEQFGSSSYSKKLPSWIKELSKSNLQILFNSLMKGDGSKTKSYTRYYTVSKRLAEDIVEIGVKLGYSVSIQTRETWNPKKTKKGISYYVSFRKSVGGVNTENKTEKFYKGNIWCLRTPSGNFFVERNGIISCSGNTMNIIGERQNPEKYVPMVIKKILENKPITIHYNSKTNEIGSRCYLHAKDVADAIYFILNLPEITYDEFHFGGKCPKFNIASTVQYDNLEIATKISLALDKNIIFEMVDPFIDRPGHDFSYQISGEYLNNLGWTPKISIDKRLPELSKWYFDNQHWLK